MARMPMQRGPMRNSAFGYRFNDGDFALCLTAPRPREDAGLQASGRLRPFILSVTRKIALRIASETRASYGP